MRPAPGAGPASRSRARSALAAVLALLAALAGLAVALAPTASAHDELVSSSPSDGARVTAPSALVLSYSESLIPTGYRVVVRGPGGRVDGDVRLSGAMVVHRFARPLPAGSYDVSWRVVSADGHPIAGTLSFTVRGPAAAPSASSSSSSSSTSSSSASSSSASSASSSPAASAASSPTTSAAGDPGSGRGGLVLGLVIAAVAAAAVAAAAAARRSRGRSTE